MDDLQQLLEQYCVAENVSGDRPTVEGRHRRIDSPTDAESATADRYPRAGARRASGACAS